MVLDEISVNLHCKLSRMRIAVNTRLLLKNRLEGIGRFSLEILSRMAKNHPEHEFIFIFDRPYDEKFIFADNIKPVVFGPQARHPFLFILWFELTIPFLLKKYKADAFLSPDGFLSLRAKKPQFGVIHDINFEHYPDDLPRLVLWYYRTFFPRFIRKAKHIFTVSEYSKEDIVRTYGTAEDKVSVVYNGVNEVYAPVDATTCQLTREQHTQGFPYFLFVGALHPRKNLVNLFKAYDLFINNTHSSTRLLIVGNKMWWTPDIKNAYEEMNHRKQVVFLGHQSISELKKIYGSALALTYVSYFEGFGIPIIESFTCGTPVITSNVTSMPEVAGDAALIVDPFNVEEIALAMQKLEEDESLRTQLIKKGKQRALEFSWDDSARKLWKLMSSHL
jgi:glycosyltransferase involved in cell wall biosynthesis